MFTIIINIQHGFLKMKTLSKLAKILANWIFLLTSPIWIIPVLILTSDFKDEYFGIEKHDSK